MTLNDAERCLMMLDDAWWRLMMLDDAWRCLKLKMFKKSIFMHMHKQILHIRISIAPYSSCWSETHPWRGWLHSDTLLYILTRWSGPLRVPTGTFSLEKKKVWYLRKLFSSHTFWQKEFIFFTYKHRNLIENYKVFSLCPKSFDFEVRGYPPPHTKKKFSNRYLLWVWWDM